jgi:hypothetical protein
MYKTQNKKIQKNYKKTKKPQKPLGWFHVSNGEKT